MLAAAAVPALAQTPLGYLKGFGPRAASEQSLTWGLLIISIVMTVIITLLVLVGVMLRRARGVDEPQVVLVERRGNGLPWIYIGVGLSTVVLFATVIWTVVVLAKVGAPPTPPDVTIEVTGQQWWWKARYLNDDPSQVFVTADEIHIPLGQPIRFRLMSEDVIHSFWIPALGGKTETVPGQINETWLQADRAGSYLGQCAEFCGDQHAHMALRVIAEPADQFQTWRKSQIASATVSAGMEGGAQTFVRVCGACHAVRGTDAGGTVAPDLTHLMSRGMLAGGVVPNTIGNLAGWIANPQQLKPGTHMPTLYLSGPELQSVVGFLKTLK
jgi:cytochrome c oxidase subunit 2